MTTVGRTWWAALLEHHGGAVAEDLGRRGARRHFGGVEAHPDHRIRAYLLGVLDHEVVRRLTRLVAHLGVGADLAADDALQTAEDALGDGGRPHRNAPHHALVFADVAALHVERRGHEDRRSDRHRTLPSEVMAARRS